MADGWLGRLERACQRQGQAAVARVLGFSPATVSLVLRGKYPAESGAIQKKVEELLLDEQVICPEMGEIGVEVCLEQQKKRFSTANPQRVRMWRACRGGCRYYREERA